VRAAERPILTPSPSPITTPSPATRALPSPLKPVSNSCAASSFPQKCRPRPSQGQERPPARLFPVKPPSEELCSGSTASGIAPRPQPPPRRPPPGTRPRHHSREVIAVGRSMTGRPHFARVLMEKGYVSPSAGLRRIPRRVRRSLRRARRAVTRRGHPPHRRWRWRPLIAHPIRLGRRAAAGRRPHPPDEQNGASSPSKPITPITAPASRSATNYSPAATASPSPAAPISMAPTSPK
jgi:hypothetical protein